jgi:hypothetical protein
MSSPISDDDLDLLGAPTSVPSRPTTIIGGRKDAPAVNPHYHPSNPETWRPALKIVPLDGTYTEVSVDIANPRNEGKSSQFLRTPSGAFINRQFLCGYERLGELQTTLRHVAEIQRRIDQLRTLQLSASNKAIAICLASTFDGPSPQMTIEEAMAQEEPSNESQD